MTITNGLLIFNSCMFSFHLSFHSVCGQRKKIEQLDTHGPTAFKNEKKVSLNLMKQYTYVLVFTFNKKPFLMSKGV